MLYLAIIGKRTHDVIGVCRFDEIADNEFEEPGSSYAVISKQEFETFGGGWGAGVTNATRQSVLDRPRLRASKRVIYSLEPR